MNYKRCRCWRLTKQFRAAKNQQVLFTIRATVRKLLTVVDNEGLSSMVLVVLPGRSGLLRILSYRTPVEVEDEFRLETIFAKYWKSKQMPRNKTRSCSILGFSRFSLTQQAINLDLQYDLHNTRDTHRLMHRPYSRRRLRPGGHGCSLRGITRRETGPDPRPRKPQ